MKVRNPKVTVKQYMDFYDCSERTAYRYRANDKEALGKRHIRYSDFRLLYGCVPEEFVVTNLPKPDKPANLMYGYA